MIEMFYLNSTLKFGILPVLVFQLEVYYVVDRLLTGLTALQKGTSARWYSNKTSLCIDDLKIDRRQRMFPVRDDDQWRVGLTSEVID